MTRLSDTTHRDGRQVMQFDSVKEIECTTKDNGKEECSLYGGTFSEYGEGGNMRVVEADEVSVGESMGVVNVDIEDGITEMEFHMTGQCVIIGEEMTGEHVELRCDSTFFESNLEDMGVEPTGEFQDD